MKTCEHCGGERKLYHPCPNCGQPTFRESGVVGVVHVDFDSPNVIRTGETSFAIFPEEDSNALEPTPLGDDWQEIGYTTEDGIDTPFGRFDVP